MDLGLAGKVALVTGSSRGIGRAIAELLAGEGCAIMLTGRDEAALAAAQHAIVGKGGKVKSQRAELREPAVPAALVDAVKRDFGRLDIVVHNAGATKRGDFLALTDEDWADGFALKFFAHMRLARAAWPLLKETSGAVLAIGGNGAAKPTADFTIGSSVNAAVAAFHKALSDIGKRDGIQVNTIHPGHVDTDRMRRQMDLRIKKSGRDMASEIEAYRKELNVPRIGVPDDVAAMAAFILSPRGRWLHGATVILDGGEIEML
ncbi:MAG TPA: SDR family oxidoreductase [Stellaceae bacterium]|jgi:3-oxoacyl-[acyl-carrier protein] reductase|nr:SDR family oxidoreductase [Stellaceae bacterium]